MAHIPVLKNEVLEYLDPKPNENFIDCTFGEGGHAEAILEKNKPNGRILGIDLDEDNIQKYKGEKDRLILAGSSYTNLKEIAKNYNFSPINGILLDLGMSSWHIDESERGFSFLKDEPLNMRYSKNSGITAEGIANEYSIDEIEKILKEYGEERFSKRIAEAIIEERKAKPVKTTFQLVEIIKKAIPYKYQRGKINPATRVFQALRIAVNDELNNLKKVLPIAIDILEKEGRIAVISFHSLEDRIVKNFFKQLALENKIKILTKKPIMPSEEEVNKNHRARSAKLRAAVKI